MRNYDVAHYSRKRTRLLLFRKGGPFGAGAPRPPRIAGTDGVCFNWAAMTNTLYYGDNLEILREHVPDESVDLVFLDPPFNSNASYNVQVHEQGRLEAPG